MSGDEPYLRPPGPIFLPRPIPSREKRFPAHWDEVHEFGNESRDGPLQPHLAEAARRVTPTATFTRKKIAAGLILVRTPEQSYRATDCSGGRHEYQAVLIKGRLSYAFSEFIHGRYERSRLDTVHQLLVNMTIEERLLVETLDFEKMWNHTWTRPHARTFDWRPGGTSAFERMRIQQQGWPPYLLSRDALYLRKRTKFNDAWLTSDGSSRILKQMALETRGTGKIRWELPKGKRHSPAESDISCAIREFQEETRIAPGAYRILPGFSRVEMYVHMKVLYVNTYYLAVLNHQIADPASHISLANYDQVSEVSDVRWMGLEAMRRAVGPVGRDLTVMGQAAFKFVRNYLKGKGPRPRFTPSVDFISQAFSTTLKKLRRPPSPKQPPPHRNVRSSAHSGAQKRGRRKKTNPKKSSARSASSAESRSSLTASSSSEAAPPPAQNETAQSAEEEGWHVVRRRGKRGK